MLDETMQDYFRNLNYSSSLRLCFKVFLYLQVKIVENKNVFLFYRYWYRQIQVSDWFRSCHIQQPSILLESCHCSLYWNQDTKIYKEGKITFYSDLMLSCVLWLCSFGSCVLSICSLGSHVPRLLFTWKLKPVGLFIWKLCPVGLFSWQQCLIALSTWKLGLVAFVHLEAGSCGLFTWKRVTFQTVD